MKTEQEYERIFLSKTDNKGFNISDSKNQDTLFVNKQIIVPREITITVQNPTNKNIETYMFSGEVNIENFELCKEGDIITFEKGLIGDFFRVYNDKLLGIAVFREIKKALKHSQFKTIVKSWLQPSHNTNITIFESGS
jgi:hypothetical protein